MPLDSYLALPDDFVANFRFGYHLGQCDDKGVSRCLAGEISPKPILIVCPAQFRQIGFLVLETPETGQFRLHPGLKLTHPRRYLWIRGSR